MSDESNKRAGNGEAAPVAGELLARARLAREISLQEIAKDLHLDEPKVRALEQNQFEALGAPVFAKGYLRRYAELVGVPEDDVIADYYRLNRTATAPPLVTKRPRPIREFSPTPWIAGLVALMVVVLGISWWFTSGANWFAERRGTAIDAPVTNDATGREGADTPAGEVDSPAGTLTAAPAPTAVPVAGDTSGALDATTGTDAQAGLAGGAPAAADDGSLGLRLAFTGDCWTEVTDANGQRLYFGLGTSGDEVAVSGEPPLNVLLGSAENVAVFVSGRAYTIPPSARRGETARLTLGPVDN